MTGSPATKVAIEYALSGAYAFAALLLLIRARREHSAELAWLATAAWTLVLAELYFTLYANVTDVFNLLGHVLKVIAYIMVYRAIFVAGVQDPYRQLARETSLLRSLIDSVPDLISFTDQDGRLLGVNRAFSSRFHIAPDDAVGRSPVDVAWTDGRARTRLPLMSDTSERFEESVPDAAGVLQVFDTLQTPYFTAKGERLGVIEVSRDVTAQRRAEERIHQLALYDHLTGLPNRILLGDEAARVVHRPGPRRAGPGPGVPRPRRLQDHQRHRRAPDRGPADPGGRPAPRRGRGLRRSRRPPGRGRVRGAGCAVEPGRRPRSSRAGCIAAIDQPFRIERYDLAVTASAGIAMFPTDGATFDGARRAGRRRHVPRQAGRPAHLPLLQRRHAGQCRRAAGAAQRPAQGRGERRAGRALPAADLPGRRHDRRGRGPRPLAAPDHGARSARHASSGWPRTAG